MLWAYDRHERLAAARDHSRAILEGLRRERCEVIHNWGRVILIDRRIAVAEARYRRLCQLARTARRTARMEAAAS